MRIATLVTVTVLAVALAEPAGAIPFDLQVNCAKMRWLLAGFGAARIAMCHAQAADAHDEAVCREQVRHDEENTALTLEAQGCPALDIAESNEARAVGQCLPGVPEGFYDDCTPSARGGCEGSCAAGSFRTCAELETGGCGCVPLAE
ncbi:MAG TPA: hypothetical protein VFD92_26965 [Candidatus Binatia bacterium]|nr:hypothetical protein [Candidatus Binatia bacterium]